MVMKNETLKVHNTNRVWKEDGSNFCFLAPRSFSGILCVKLMEHCAAVIKNVLSSLDSVHSESCSC